jgi:carboxypeptidase C (cathepsin A)
MVGEYQMGKPLDRVLDETRERLRSENFALFSAAMQASRESGGKLNETVERIAHSVLELQRLERKIKSETAQARASAVYMAMAPFAVLLMYYLFIDPVNTGFSRAEDPKNVSEFLGVQEDIQSVGEFMRLWVTREQRWRSPKFIAGESYGGIRGGGLAQHLQQRHRMYLNGIIIVSGLLDYSTLIAGPLNDTPYLVGLPAMTATAHYHKKLPPDLQADFKKAVAEAREFAFGEYASALLKGADLTKVEREAVVKKLARLTGLEPKLIEEQELRIDSGVFREMLLRKEKLVLGAYDARVTGTDGDESEIYPQIEPFMRVVGSIAAASMNAYLREELKYEKDLPYEVLAPQPNWNHGKGNSYTSVSGQLADAIRQNPHLRVLAMVGWRDLVTPPDNMLLSVRQMRLPDELRGNIEFAEYESGHMMYTNRPDMAKMHENIAAFIGRALK